MARWPWRHRTASPATMWSSRRRWIAWSSSRPVRTTSSRSTAPTADRRTSSTRFDESEPEQMAGVARDHALLVGGDHPGASGGVGLRADGAPGGVALRGVDQAEPGGTLAYLGADGRRVLADATGKSEGVEPAERRRQRAEVADDGVTVLLDRIAG